MILRITAFIAQNALILKIMKEDSDISRKSAEDKFLKLIRHAIQEQEKPVDLLRWREGARPNFIKVQEERLGIIRKKNINNEQQQPYKPESQNFGADYPFSAVGVLSVDAKLLGVAFIVGPKLIITCASVCACAWNTSIQGKIFFAPAEWVPQCLEKYPVKHIYLPWKSQPKGRQRNKNRAFSKNFALLEIDTQENLEHRYGSLGYDFDWLSDLIQTTAIYNTSVIGFAGSQLKHLSGTIAIENGIVMHRIEAERLSSGSPILQIVNGVYMLRGIYVSDNQPMMVLDDSLHEAIEQLFAKTTVNIDLQNKRLGCEGVRNLVSYIGIEYSQYPNTSQLLTLQETIVQTKSVNCLKKRNGIKDFSKHQKEVLYNNLRQLDLKINHIGTEGCKYLKEAHWPSLQQLDLSQNHIDAEGCRYLKQAHWPSLQKIDLRQNHIDAEGCRQLKQAYWPNLQKLYLGGNQIHAEGCRHLKEAQWPNLRQIKLSTGFYNGENIIGPEGCRFLKEAQWPKLQLLELIDNQLGADGCKHLKQSQWPNLQYLYLSRNKIGDKGCRYLKEAYWPKLQQIYLDDNQISTEGCRQLKEAQWPNLQKLSFWINYIFRNDRKSFVGRSWKVYTGFEGLGQ